MSLARIIVIACMVFALLLFGCCLWLSWPETVRRVTILATKTAIPDNVEERLLMESTRRYSGPPLPGPHGPFKNSRTTYRYYIEGGGKPRRVLPFLEDPESSSMRARWWSVADSPLWIRTFEIYPTELQTANKWHPSDWQVWVLVFNDARVVYRRELRCFGDPELRTEKGNRLIVYPTKSAFETYDVTTGSIMPASPTPKTIK